jgi:hypothetical protein
MKALIVTLPLIVACTNPSSVRVIHASADAPTLDVVMKSASGTALTFTALPYAGASAYQQLTAEDDFVFELRDPTAGASAMPLATSSSWHLAHGERVTAVIAGLANTSDDTAALQVLIEQEKFGLETGDGNTWLQLVNAIPDVPDCDIKINGTVDTGTLARFSTVETLVASGAPAAVALSSTSGLAPVATSFTATLPNPQAAFAIALGISSAGAGDDRGLSLLVAGTDGSLSLVRQDPVVYALHALPDGPAVDVYNANAEVASALAFGSLSSAIQLPPGDQSLDLFAHSATNARPGGNPIGSLALAGLQAGHSYLAVASGFVGDGRSPAFTSGLYDEAFAQSPDAALLRVVQASPDLPKATLGADDTTFTPIADFTGLGFMDSSPEAGTAITTSTLGLEPAGASAPSATFAISVSPGQSAFAVLVGASAGQATDQPLQLVQVSGWAATAIPSVTPTTP